MSDYNAYVTAVNKIFDYISKMKAGWNSQDNINYIESIEEYKTAVIGNADIFKTPAAVPEETNSNNEQQANTQVEQQQPEQAVQAVQQQSEQITNGEVAVTPENLSQNVEALGND